MSLTFDSSEFFRKTRALEVTTTKAMIDSMQDTVDDLKRISQNVAPIDKRTLRDSAQTKVKAYPKSVVGEVSFRAVGDGFNYAIWTHEADYNLGPQSAAAPGTDGYEVGNKYLERPLKGESEKYFRWWMEAVGKELGDS